MQDFLALAKFQDLVQQLITKASQTNVCVWEPDLPDKVFSKERRLATQPINKNSRINWRVGHKRTWLLTYFTHS